MQFNPKQQKELLIFLRGVYIEMLVEELTGKKLYEKRAREKYFKKVYEYLKLDEKEKEEVFMVGTLAEYVFRSLPNDFEDTHEWERKWF